MNEGYLDTSNEGQGSKSTMRDIRCMWSAIDSGFGMPLSIHPVRFVVFKFSHIDRKSRIPFIL